MGVFLYGVLVLGGIIPRRFCNSSRRSCGNGREFDSKPGAG